MSKTKIRVLALDLDGTLTNDQKVVTPATRAALDAELGLYLLNHKRERLSLMEKEFHIRLDIRIEGISSAPAAPAQQQGHQHNGQNNGR